MSVSALADRVSLQPGEVRSLVETGARHATIEIGENAILRHCRIIESNDDSFFEVRVAAGGTYESHLFVLGGERVRDTIQVRLSGAGAQTVLNGLYLARGDASIELHTVIDHAAPHGTSRELYKGILDDAARTLFDGLVVVQKDAQKTDSAQANRNLLLSPRAKALSNPELKILANDVKCKHGATIGQLDPAQLFYLSSRGIPAAEARRLLIHAFANEMIELAPDAALKERLSRSVLAPAA